MHARQGFFSPFSLQNIYMLIIINIYVGCYSSYLIKPFWGMQSDFRNAVILRPNDKLMFCLILENQINDL